MIELARSHRLLIRQPADPWRDMDGGHKGGYRTWQLRICAAAGGNVEFGRLAAGREGADEAEEQKARAGRRSRVLSLHSAEVAINVPALARGLL